MITLRFNNVNTIFQFFIINLVNFSSISLFLWNSSGSKREEISNLFSKNVNVFIDFTKQLCYYDKNMTFTAYFELPAI